MTIKDKYAICADEKTTRRAILKIPAIVSTRFLKLLFGLQIKRKKRTHFNACLLLITVKAIRFI